MNTLIAKKVGMTQIFDENAKAMGVTVLDVSDCRVVQVKNEKVDASKIRESAEAYKQEVIAVADGDSQRFLSVYKEYKEAKDVTRRRIYLETMEKVMQNMNKVIIDSDNGSGVLPYLPLPELKKSNSQQNN